MQTITVISFQLSGIPDKRFRVSTQGPITLESLQSIVATMVAEKERESFDEILEAWRFISSMLENSESQEFVLPSPTFEASGIERLYVPSGVFVEYRRIELISGGTEVADITARKVA